MATTKKVDVGSWIVKFGKHKGITYKELVSLHPKYCSWLLEKGMFVGGDPKYAETNTKILKFILSNIEDEDED